MTGRSRYLRVNCTYCKRQLTPAGTGKGTALTKDHVRPESHGGSRRVLCCVTCNGLKDNLLPEEWRWFTEAYPRYWKSFGGPSDVRYTIRQERVRRAHAGEEQIVGRYAMKSL